MCPEKNWLSSYHLLCLLWSLSQKVAFLIHPVSWARYPEVIFDMSLWHHHDISNQSPSHTDSISLVSLESVYFFLFIPPPLFGQPSLRKILATSESFM
jgi:hypothetical protein